MIFAVAEGLGRAVYSTHTQLFRCTGQEILASEGHAFSVAVGYLMVPIFFAYSVAFYTIAARHSWWLPSSALTDPNVVATYAPWFGCLAQSLSAGVLEECLFRAVPIAGSTLIYRRYVGSGDISHNEHPPLWWTAMAQILQACIFGAAHANYPAQPAHARLCELILPSFLFGFLYVRYGLVPGIVLHVLYDVVWMSLPVFSSNLLGAQFVVILISSIPCLSVMAARWRAGKWHQHKVSWCNAAWQPAKLQVRTKQVANTLGGPSFIHKIVWQTLPILAITATVITVAQTDLGRCTNSKVLAMASSSAVSAALNEAQRLALHDDFASLNVSGIGTARVLPRGWQVLTSASQAPTESDTFVFGADTARLQCGSAWSRWTTQSNRTATSASSSPSSLYDVQMADGFLWPPHWRIRIARFDRGEGKAVNVSERAEETNIGVTHEGRLIWMSHTVPEHHHGTNLTEAEARAAALQHAAKLLPSGAGEAPRIVSSKSTQQLHRLDWEIILAHGQIIKHPPLLGNAEVQQAIEGERRLQIRLVSGKVTEWSRYVHIPELWKRHERTQRAPVQVIHRGFVVLHTMVRTHTIQLASKFQCLMLAHVADVGGELPCGYRCMGYRRVARTVPRTHLLVAAVQFIATARATHSKPLALAGICAAYCKAMDVANADKCCKPRVELALRGCGGRTANFPLNEHLYVVTPFGFCIDFAVTGHACFHRTCRSSSLIAYYALNI
jgi:hypothetical protein